MAVITALLFLFRFWSDNIFLADVIRTYVSANRHDVIRTGQLYTDQCE